MAHMNILSLALYAAALLLSQMVSVTMATVTVTQNADATVLSNALFNPAAAAGVSGAIVTGATITGNVRQFGIFSQTNGDLAGLGMTGVVLSTGIATETTTGVSSSVMDGPGDPDLDTLLGQRGTTRDAAVLSMDVIVASKVSITVSYLLASNEYLDSHRRPDVFGAFWERTSVALIGDTPVVTTDTLDCDKRGGNTTCNAGQVKPFNVSGYSSTKEFTFHLLPGFIHRLKLVIADGGSDQTGYTTVLLSLKPGPNSSPTRKPATMKPTTMMGMGMAP
jgi:hypothetical protein